MRAIQIGEYGGPEVLTLIDLPDLAPDENEVVVEVRAAGINPVDTYRRAGSQGYQGALPFTPGIDGAGVIKAVGGAVKSWKVGDRVYLAGAVTGTYASECLCTPDQIFPLPESATFRQGAALWVNYGTAYRALFQRGTATAGDRVLVHGATGGVGVAALQWSALYGLSTAATYGSADGKALLSELGVNETVDHRAPSHADELAKAAGERGFDVVLEMLANVNLELDLSVLASGGRVMIVGSRGEVTITPRRLMGAEGDVRGVMLYGATDGERQAIHAAIAAGLNAGGLAPIIQEEIPLAEAARAHERVISAPSRGKIVLIP